MLFNSVEFFIFLPIVFTLYWILNGKTRSQNFLLLVASYFFYGWWDWRFLFLIAFSSLVDYVIGNKLYVTEKSSSRKFLLFASLFVNIGFLGVFKYYNFFAENFENAFTLFGQHIEASRLNVILPVGISFYTFQTLSYSIDIFRKKLEPSRDIISFLSFVSFFPQLVAGPIERASNLLPQFYIKRNFSYAQASDGLRQILWGLFKKVVIADNCAYYVNDIFLNYEQYSGSTLFLGAVFFSFQIYGDFSGYSDIAIGTSKLFGFTLMRNFAYPYFSRDIAEFWRRWHISLSTWFRDYLYIPLGGSKGGIKSKIRNTFIIFLVSGFWHGANWTFLIWGFLNALYFLPLLLVGNNRNHIDNVAQNKIFISGKDLIKVLSTFILTNIAWVFFRADSATHAFSYLSHMFSLSLFSRPETLPFYLIILIVILIIFEWFQRNKEHGLDVYHLHFIPRWSVYIGFSILIISFFSNKNEFIYFQF